MIKQLLIVSCLTISVLGQYQSSISTTPAPQPPAQVHYVNIGADLAGDYKFGYDTGKGPNGQSFREESRSADGTVRGAYGYTDAGGQQRIVKYSAGKDGFKIDDDSPAPSSGGSAPSYRQPSAQSAPSYRQPAPTNPPQVYRPPQTLPPQTYRAPSADSYRPPSSDSSSYSSPSQGNYLELNARPVQTYRAPAPAQTLRSYLPSSYSSPSSSSSGSLSNSLSSYTSGLSSSSLSNSGGSSASSYPASYPQSYPASQPTLQTYRPQSRPASSQGASQPALRSYSNLASTPRPEEQTWGPPVINTALLSYNIGAQGGQQVSSYLSSSSGASQSGRTYQAQPVSRPVSTRSDSISPPILRSYSGLSTRKPVEENWGPPVINTALLSYNIGSSRN